MRHKILLVDDEPDVLDLLVFLVERTGALALPAREAPAALRLFDNERPDLAIVDVMLGSSSGLDLVAELRSRSDILVAELRTPSDMPIILLTARGSEDDKVRGLEAGADDYLVKPFGHRELVARIRAHLRSTRRAGGQDADRVILRSGPLTLDVARHMAEKEGRSLNLTATEFRLLLYLMDRAGTVVPTGTLLKNVWGYDDPGAREVLRVALYRLRHKLEDDPRAPRLLHTIPGVGVVLKGESTEPSAEHAAS